MSVASISTQEIGPSDFESLDSPTLVLSTRSGEEDSFVSPAHDADANDPVAADVRSSDISTIALDGNDVPRNNDPSAIVSEVRLEGGAIDCISLPLVDIASFLPILCTLPGLVFSGGTYQLPCHLSKEHLNLVMAYTRRIEGLNLTDSGLPESALAIMIRIMIRLLQNLNPSEPLFPSLKRLHIVNANSKLAPFLSLFLTPSLESLDVTGTSEDQHDALLSFLIDLSNYPNGSLSSISVGLSSISLGAMDHCLNFTHLRELHLRDVRTPEASFLKKIGELARLETLIFFESTPKIFPEIRRETENDCMKTAPTQDFQNLKTIHVTAILETLEALMLGVSSKELKDVSLVLVTSSVRRRVRLIGKKSGQTMQARKAIKKSVKYVYDEDAFASLIEAVLTKWASSITSISVRRKFAQASDSCTSESYNLPDTTFESLLLQGSLKHLEIGCWLGFRGEEHLPIFMAVESSELQFIHLPVEGMQGISLTTLDQVARKCPNLVSFQSNITNLADIPDYSNPETPKQTPHVNLQELFVGNGPLSYPIEDSGYLLRVAQHLDILYPNLKTIKPTGGQNVTQWKYIEDLVRMCQMSRSYHSS